MLPLAQLNVLPNGLRILNAPLPGSDLTTVVVAVRAGSRCETAEERGLAHFLEHMFLKGCRKYPTAHDLDLAINGIGGYHNATTHMEYTYYTLQVPSERGGTALEIIAEMLLNPLFPEKEFSHEKRVVIDEHMRRRESDETYISILFQETVIGRQPLGLDIGGTKKSVGELTRDQVLDFRSRWYVPNNMMVTILGGGQHDLLAQKAAQLFGNLRPAPVAAWEPYIRNEAASKSRGLIRESQITNLMIGVAGFQFNSPFSAAQQSLETVFGGSASSRLHARIREQEGLAYSVTAESEFFSDGGYLAVTTSTSSSGAQAVLKRIIEEYQRLLIEPVTQEELDIAKAVLVSRMAHASDNHEQLARLYVQSVLVNGVPVQLEAVRAGFAAVTLAAVRYAAMALLFRQPFYLTSIGPKKLDLPDTA